MLDCVVGGLRWAHLSHKRPVASPVVRRGGGAGLVGEIKLPRDKNSVPKAKWEHRIRNVWHSGVAINQITDTEEE